MSQKPHGIGKNVHIKALVLNPVDFSCLSQSRGVGEIRGWRSKDEQKELELCLSAIYMYTFGSGSLVSSFIYIFICKMTALKCFSTFQGLFSPSC